MPSDHTATAHMGVTSSFCLAPVFIRDEHEASELHVQLASSDELLTRLDEVDPPARLALPRHELRKSQLASCSSLVFMHTHLTCHTQNAVRSYGQRLYVCDIELSSFYRAFIEPSPGKARLDSKSLSRARLIEPNFGNPWRWLEARLRSQDLSSTRLELGSARRASSFRVEPAMSAAATIVFVFAYRIIVRTIRIVVLSYH
jgi:hypothetical protein